MSSIPSAPASASNQQRAEATIAVGRDILVALSMEFPRGKRGNCERLATVLEQVLRLRKSFNSRPGDDPADPITITYVWLSNQLSWLSLNQIRDAFNALKDFGYLEIENLRSKGVMVQVTAKCDPFLEDIKGVPSHRKGQRSIDPQGQKEEIAIDPKGQYLSPLGSEGTPYISSFNKAINKASSPTDSQGSDAKVKTKPDLTTAEFPFLKTTEEIQATCNKARHDLGLPPINQDLAAGARVLERAVRLDGIPADQLLPLAEFIYRDEFGCRNMSSIANWRTKWRNGKLPVMDKYEDYILSRRKPPPAQPTNSSSFLRDQIHKDK